MYPEGTQKMERIKKELLMIRNVLVPFILAHRVSLGQLLVVVRIWERKWERYLDIRAMTRV